MPQPAKPSFSLEEPCVVAPSIWRITVPIPFPLRTVNVYALVATDGWVLVDTAIGAPASRVAFHAGLHKAGLAVQNLRAIVLTHAHPDHIGLSAELHEQSGAPVYMHTLDESLLQNFWANPAVTQERDAVSLRFFAQHGFPPTPVLPHLASAETTASFVRIPPHAAFTLVEDGQQIELAHELYRIIWVPGHSDGQISLLRERDGVFLAADHVLPHITPNISLYAGSVRLNPLHDYLNLLQKVRDLPATLVLPGHLEPFVNMTERVDEISSHHEVRLQQLLDLLAVGPQHAYALTQQLFKQRLKDDTSLYMAAGEILAHLEYLRSQEKLHRYLENEQIFYTL